MTPPLRRRWLPDWPIDLDLVLGPMLRGRTDPMARRGGAQDWWLAGRTASGPMTLNVRRAGSDVEAQAWGAGAAEVVERLPELLGDQDDPSGFEPQAGTVIAEQWRKHGAFWRVPATGLIWECAVASVLEQKVTGQEARRGWYRLCREHGEPAPGPAPEAMFIVPDRDVLVAVPSWWWRGAGVDHARAGTLQRLARIRLDGDVPRRLRSIPGIGPWTVAEVSFRALGDPDAVSVGDFHLANLVGYALTGRPRSTDEQLLDLLRPYAGHRYRAIRMIELAGVRPPRFGPRRRLPEHF